MRRSTMTKPVVMLAFLAAVAGAVLPASAAGQKAPGMYATAAEARTAGPAFDIQGEYEGTIGGNAKKKVGVQVIALGGKEFQAVFLAGGLPGAGWDGKTKVLCQGTLEGGKVTFAPAAGKRKYMAGRPSEFSATATFPPKTQKDYTAAIEGEALTGKTDTGEAIAARKVHRKSPTLGAKPPAGAVVLLAYEPGKAPSLEAWKNQKWHRDPEGFVRVIRRSGGNSSTQTFAGPWRMHVEFMSPFQPTARSQGRGNSGVFPPGGREIQVLDSFGLEGKPNECGGIYKSHPPRVNMCLPPLSWQTYDVEYHPGGKGADGKNEPAWYKVVHNGVVIHEKLNLGRARTGTLNLQDHGNPVSYRNIWFVVRKRD